MCTNRKSSRKSQGNQTHLKFAMLYHALGWNVIPIDPVDGKKSLVKWKKYQEERVHKDLVRDWWTKNPNANIGIVTGALSGLVVLDADSEKARQIIKKMG